LPPRDNRRERIQRALEEARRLAEQGAKDVGDAVSRGVRDVSDRARRPDKKGAGPDGGESGSPSVEEVAADPAAFFSAEQQRATEQLGLANILISGQTGVGKSTLINAVFRVPLAKEGTGKPVTKHVQRHEVAGVPVTIFDTPGIELGQAKNAVIREYKRTITESRKRSPRDVIHVAWYCIDAGQTRVQDYDAEIVRALADELPVILVLTQCIDDDRADALEEVIRADALPIDGRPVRTLARARTVAGQTLPPRGLEELVERTNSILPEAVRRAFANAQGVVIRLKAGQARAVVAASSVAAGGVGAVPIPVPDAAVLMPVQLGMLASITAVFGIDMGDDRAVSLIRGLVGQGGITVVGRQIAANLLKVIPGVSVVNAAVAAALTAALGEAYIQLCSEMLRRQTAGKPMLEAEMLPFLLEAYRKAFRRPGGRRGGAARPLRDA
jgi:small GTP-binding protein